MSQTAVLTVGKDLAESLKSLGAKSLFKCYQCGTCTAICPLSEESTVKTRRLIKYIQLGLKEKVLGDLTPWLCYYCGECSDNCPKDANPGEIMMAVRRYATQQLSWGKVGKIFYSRTAAAVAFVLFSVFAIAMMAIFHGEMNLTTVDIYSFIDYELIHGVGLVAGAFIGLSALANLIIMYTYAKRWNGASGSLGSWVSSFFKVLFKEVLAQARFTKCENVNRYLAHMSLFWGFVGLFVATSIHYAGDIFGFEVNVAIPRTLGIITGILLMYGSIYFIAKRLEKKERYALDNHFSDWLFLWLMFFTGLTGFLITIFLYANMPMATYIMYALHLLFIFDLLITAPFTKFMHALYRPFALWFNEAWGLR